jgi:hypothetical protein
MVTLLCAGLALGSCTLVDFALSSTFPAAATRMTARRDLSILVSSSDASSFSMGDVTAGGREYVILSSGLQSDGTRLIIMDTGLTILLTLTSRDPAGWGGLLGNAPARLDATGQILIGNVAFPTNASGLAFPTVSPAPPRPSWTLPISASPGADTSFFVHAVFSDPDPARQAALFVLYDSGDSRDHYLVIPFIPLQVFYEAFTKPATREDHLGYSNGGFIRFVEGGSNPGSGAFVRCDLGGADQSNQLHYFNLPVTRQAFSPSGGNYFSFDLGTRIVTRLTAWWN